MNEPHTTAPANASARRIGPIERLAVPTGTAAATVIATEPSTDPVCEARRFARIAALCDIEFRAQFEELVVSGVYTVLHGRLLVMRIVGAGVRNLAFVARSQGADPPLALRDGLDTLPIMVEVPTERAQAEGLWELALSESRQRPVFHGVTGSGITYSGFGVLHTEAVLAALSRVEELAPTRRGLVVFSLGGPLELPAGLLVGVERATR